MKKQKTQLITLLILLVVLVAGYFGVGAYTDYAATKASNQKEAAMQYLTQYEQEEVTSLSYTYEEIEYTFVKEEDAWTYPTDTTISLDETKLNVMANRIGTVETDTIIEDVTDLSQYGLDAPERVICFTTSDGEHEITFGSVNSMTSVQYVYLDGDTSKVYAIASTIAGNFNKSIEDLTVEEEVSVDVSGVE